MTPQERYNYNETMRLVGHCAYTLTELGEQHGYEGIMQIVEAYAADTLSGKIIANTELKTMLTDVFLLGTIHGVKRERRRRHNAGKEMR